jgi:glycine/D-amino acid oxidase-like deaminating enzyme
VRGCKSPGIDFLIIGAGIIGLSTAYHIKSMSPGSRVVIVEKNPGPGMGDTSRSAAMFRVFFSSKTNMILAKSSVEYFEHVEKNIGWDLGIRYLGYLFLVDSKELENMKPALDEAERLGGSYRIIDRDSLKNQGFNVDVSTDPEASLMGLPDIEAGIYIPKAGTLDPDSLVRYYEHAFKSLGGEILYNTEVKRIVLGPKNPLGIPGEPFAWQDIEAKGVETSSGYIEARSIVVAAGAYTRELLEPIGIDPIVNPKKRQIFVIRANTKGLADLLNTKGYNAYNVIPFTILPRGVYIKPEIGEKSFWVGLSDNLGRRYGLEEELKAEESFYRYSIHPVLTRYLPQFSQAYPDAMWAGYYDINPIDGQPVIFMVGNIEVVAGTSGSGIMKADAIGRIASALALGYDEVELYGGIRIRSDMFGLVRRYIDPEKLIL